MQKIYKMVVRPTVIFCVGTVVLRERLEAKVGGLQIFTGSEQEEKIRNDLTDSLGVMEDIGQRMMKMEEKEEEVV